MDVNYIDITIVVIILITALIGFMRGLVWMATFIATWIVAGFLAFTYKDQLASALPIKLGSDFAQTALAALLIFLGVLIVGAIINAIFNKLIKSVGFGTFDRILGIGLGALLGALAISLLTMLLGLTELPKQEAWAKSKFIPKFQEAAAWIKSKVPDDINKYIDDSFGNTTPPAVNPSSTILSPTPTDSTAEPAITPSSN
ncbi:MAG: CvpA family protein [Cocleimonas sp.]|nr:CvpA family protein [Cocleimonas sp.]